MVRRTGRRNRIICRTSRLRIRAIFCFGEVGGGEHETAWGRRKRVARKGRRARKKKLNQKRLVSNSRLYHSLCVYYVCALPCWHQSRNALLLKATLITICSPFV